MLRRLFLSLVYATVMAGCAAEHSPSVEPIPVPTQSPGPPPDSGPQECPGALLEGTLVRHDQAGIAVQGDPNFPPSVVVWPAGWAARDVDGVRELMNGDGRTVAREGDHVSAGGFNPPDDWFHPCGEITFTP